MVSVGKAAARSVCRDASVDVIFWKFSKQTQWANTHDWTVVIHKQALFEQYNDEMGAFEAGAEEGGRYVSRERSSLSK